MTRRRAESAMVKLLLAGNFFMKYDLICRARFPVIPA
jgi:hypothetical protein